MQNMSNSKKYLITFITITLIHLFVSYIFFSIIFATGESKSGMPNNLILNLFSILSSILLCFLKIIEYFDKIYYAKVGSGFPNFVYFPLGFIVNSLLWGAIVTYIIKQLRGRRGGGN